MNQYQVYVHPEGNYEAVKQGWSWPAFFFSSLWAIVVRLWLPLFGYFLAVIVFIAIAISLDISIEEDWTWNIISLAVSVVFGVNANTWRGKNLLKRGYELKNMVIASNPENAIRVYVKELRESK